MSYAATKHDGVNPIAREELARYVSDKLVEVFLYSGVADDFDGRLNDEHEVIGSMWYDAAESTSPEEFVEALFALEHSDKEESTCPEK